MGNASRTKAWGLGFWGFGFGWLRFFFGLRVRGLGFRGLGVGTKKGPITVNTPPRVSLVARRALSGAY